ncbi:MAG: DUF2339 domain-containing protein [Halothiobacillus sp.]
MAWIFAIIGAFLGLGAAGFSGLLGGGVIGYLVGRVARLSDQVKTLLDDQHLLRDQLAQLRQPAGNHADTHDETLAQNAAFTNLDASLINTPVDLPTDRPEPGPQQPVFTPAYPDFDPVLAPFSPTPETAASAVPAMAAQTVSPVISYADAASRQKSADFGAKLEAHWGRDVPEPTQDNLLTKAYRLLTEGNVVAKIGVIVLFFGLAFLLKYAADRALFPIELRLGLVGVGGLVLLGLGWLLRRKHASYALVLQGGGIGVMYLTLYAAYRLYGLMPASITLALMLMIVAAAAVLAIRQDACSLAVLGIVGGFLAPILAGSHGGQHVDLFSYYLVLDFGIVLIAWRKAWRLLNLLAFVFTFVIGTAWGTLDYKPAFFSTTEPFLIGFYLIFLATAILFARQRQADGQRDYVQSSLVFGPPLVGFGLQALLVQNFEYGLAWSAFVLGVGYLALSVWLRRVQGNRYQILTDAFLALGLGFVTLAVPFAFSGQWTSTTWALEGVAMLWIGLRQNKRLPVIFGLLLQLGAGVAFGNDPPAINHTWPLLDGFFLSGGLIALSGLACAFLLRQQANSRVLLLWGLAWWFGVGFYALWNQTWFFQPFTLWLIFASVSLWLMNLLRLRVTDWPFLRRIPVVLLGFMYGLGAIILSFNMSPFHEYGWLAWLLAFAGLYGALYWHERRHEPVIAAERLHGLGLWLLAAVFAPELADGIFRWFFGYTLNFALIDLGPMGLIHPTTPGAWAAMSWGLVPVLMLLWLGFARHWPFAEHFGHAATYRGWVAAGLVVFLMGWLFVVNGLWLPDDALGQGWALPGQIGYAPLVNGPDVLTGFIALTLFWFGRAHGAYWPLGLARAGRWGLGAAAFLWMNALIARSLNAYAGLALDDWQFLHSALAQTTYSIAWSLLGLALIVLASRMRQRRLWLTAAGLLGVVVVKLFLVDLSGSDTLARIISFVGVGVLLLLAGYVAPIPAKRADEESAVSSS